MALPPKVSGKSPPKVQGGGRGKTVLVVDGDREHRARLVRLLRDAESAARGRDATSRKPGEAGSPPAIHEADDGHAAWALIEVTKPDLIVTEILIEGLSGLQLLRRVREQFSGKGNAPAVLFVTDMSNEVDRYWALRNGAAGYVIKPYDDEFLRQRVIKILANEGVELSAWPDEGA